MYAEGNGVTKDYQEAIKWYRMAAEKGLNWALYGLGQTYKDKKNYQEAIKWYRLALEKDKDFYSPMLRIGELYYLRGLTKRGLPDDKKELEGEVVDFDKGDGLNSFAEAQKWFNKTIETCTRISKDTTKGSMDRAAAGIMEANAEWYLAIVKKAINRGK